MPVSRAKPVLPFYFGADRDLFGCYHEPRAGHIRNCAVVICQPMGHEYINCHRALRQLASLLSDSGFPVLRFDYYGCGDSSGEAEEGRISRWLEDISNAIAEIRLRAGVTAVCLVGLRLGATLSLVAATERGDIDTVVLWDPIATGEAYLEALFGLQKEALSSRLQPLGGRKSEAHMEVIGFPLPTALCTELATLNLFTLIPRPELNILAVETDQELAGSSLARHFHKHQVRFEHQQIRAPRIWLPTVDGSLLVPNQILQSVVSWTARTHA